jgi:hypothetical protein
MILIIKKFWYFCALHGKMKKYLLALAFTLMGTFSFAQTAEVGVFGGLTYYLGDINPGIHFLMSKPAFGALARVNLDERWTVKINVFRGTASGDDKTGQTNSQRNLRFESKITDIATTVEFNFFDYLTGSRKNLLTPYIFGGIGMVLFNPKANGVSLHDAGTEGQNIGFEGRKPYSLVAFTIPFGVGFKYSLSRRLSLTGEWGMRKTFTDYLDDVSTTYYLYGSQIVDDPEELLSDPTKIHQPREQRGDPGTMDWYNFTGVTLTYKFRLYNKNKCPNQWK